MATVLDRDGERDQRQKFRHLGSHQPLTLTVLASLKPVLHYKLVKEIYQTTQPNRSGNNAKHVLYVAGTEATERLARNGYADGSTSQAIKTECKPKFCALHVSMNLSIYEFLSGS